MARNKQDDPEDFNEPMSEDDNYDLGGVPEQEAGNREALDNLPTLEAFLNPEDYLYRIKKSMLGFEIQDGEYVRITEPWATSAFINLYINSLRGVITQHNMWSSLRADEAAFNMLEKLKEVIYAAVDYGVDHKHIETLVNIFDNALQLFYGIIIDGKGAENIKQVLTSVYRDMSNRQGTNDKLVNWGLAKKKLDNLKW